MRIVYYDEAGDDGYPKYSTESFVLSALYMPYLAWRDNFEQLHGFRRRLAKSVGLPVRTEFHTRQFLVNKNPYRAMGIPDSDRLTVVDEYCDLLASLDLRLTGDEASRFLIITDPGRVGKMRKTTRKVQRINFIPSRFGPYAYRREIERLIEDPLPKDSRESYFIQSADLVTYIVYLHTHFQKGVGSIHGRMPAGVDGPRVLDWMNRLKPSLNLAASRADPFGIYYHPT